MKAINGLKICSMCRNELEVVQFYKNKRSTDGFGDRCKKCHSEYIKQYYRKEENRERRRIRQRGKLVKVDKRNYSELLEQMTTKDAIKEIVIILTRLLQRISNQNLPLSDQNKKTETNS